MDTEREDQPVPDEPDNATTQDVEEQYRSLTDETRSVLRAFVLLQSIGLKMSHPARVALVAAELFGLTGDHWEDARRALLAAGWIEAEPSPPDAAEDDPDAPLTLTCPPEVEQDVLIHMLPDDQGLPALWAQLEPALMRWGDAAALLALGESFNIFPWGDPQANQRHAVACYQAALGVSTRDEDPATWAMTQNNLGNALGALAQFVSGAEQADALRGALTAFAAALEVYTREEAPTTWATVQNNLGNAKRQAALAAQAEEQPEEADQLLQEAMGRLRAALEVRTPAASLERWAETQNNLANTLLAAADLADGEERAALLQQAVDIYREILVRCNVGEMPGQWAATQNNLGTTLNQEAATLQGEPRRARLEAALDAYRAALQVYTREVAPFDWAMAQYNVGVTLHSLADLVPAEAQAEVLTQAIAAFIDTLEVYTPEAAPADCAQVCYRLALLQRSLAGLQAEAAQTRAALEDAQRFAEVAMTLFHSLGDDTRGMAAYTLSRQIEEELQARGGGGPEDTTGAE